MPFAVGQLLLSPRSASLVRRFGAKVVALAGMLVMAVALAGYVLLGTASPVWLLGLLFFVQGAGIGVAMPAATSAVMDVLPRERAGAGSALTNTARQVGVALGVAVLGSILAQSYHQTLSPTLAASRPPRGARPAGRSGDAGRGRPARLGGPVPAGARERCLRQRHARDHDRGRGHRAGWCDRGAALDARSERRPGGGSGES